eukprot:7592121-Pyramimonas_sp.AAC.1
MVQERSKNAQDSFQTAQEAPKLLQVDPKKSAERARTRKDPPNLFGKRVCPSLYYIAGARACGK